MKLALRFTLSFSLLACLLPAPVFGQAPTVVVRQPDCQRPVSFAAVGASTWLDNRQSGCTVWAFSYSGSNIATVNVDVQSGLTDTTNTGPDVSTIMSFAGPTTGGTNPNTNTRYGYWQGTGYFPWLRVRVVTFTALGPTPANVSGILFGWRPNIQSNSTTGGGSVSPVDNPNIYHYESNVETVLAGTTERLTIQSCNTCDAVYFENADVYCSAAFSVQFQQNGTAATTTAATVVGINGVPTSLTALAFSQSNAGAGTTLGKYYGSASQTQAYNLGAFSMQTNGGTGKNLSMLVTSTPGTTCRLQMRWRRELE